MVEFNDVIGYSAIKKELEQIADVLKNDTAYKRLGVAAPRGLILYGTPGVGKTLMANCLIKASGRKAFICRKDKPGSDFIASIKDTFSQAAANAPSVVLLDDMDKYANEDEFHTDTEEYVTVQSCIDEMKGSDVFVLSTANTLNCFPDSLLRAGRFDKLINVKAPSDEDAIHIIKHYLAGKEFVTDVDAAFIARVMHRRSCAELETVINEAGLYAGFERADKITMDHFLKACMKLIYKVQLESSYEDDYSDTTGDSASTYTQIAYHEAGHAVISEVLCPNSVTIVSAYDENTDLGGFASFFYNKNLTQLQGKQIRIMSALGGMAATEQRFGIIDTGSQADLEKAFSLVKELVGENCICGFHLHSGEYNSSEQLKSKQEIAVACEIERYYRKAKEILALNREFHERVACQLIKNKILTTYDIQNIKAECKICQIEISE